MIISLDTVIIYIIFHSFLPIGHIEERFIITNSESLKCQSVIDSTNKYCWSVRQVLKPIIGFYQV